MSVADKLKLGTESFSVEGTITSITTIANGATANVVGKAGHYGKVWLTYNFLVNPKHVLQMNIVIGILMVIKSVRKKYKMDRLMEL